MSRLAQAQALWDRSQPYRGPVFCVTGMGVDLATLQLEDTTDQVILVANLLALVPMLALSQRLARGRYVPELVQRVNGLVEAGTQFLLGSLLSALAISVLRAVHPGPGALFLSLLLGLALANEARVRAARGTTARFGLLAFFAFQVHAMLLPYLTGKLLGPLPALFGTGLVVSVCVGLAWVPVPAREPPPATTERLMGLWLPVGASTGALLLLLGAIRVGLVPPLPLAMKRAAVAEGIAQTPEGPELVEPRWTQALWRLVLGPPVMRWSEGDEVVVYTAVHAPEDLALTLTHAWERWDSTEGWVQTDDLKLQVRGGREGGWRTWSRKRHLREGAWRVRVLSPRGQELGRVPFTIRMR
jgi:hypothetical protein